MPNAAALTSEYVPRRRRPIAVTLTIVCVPLGGMLAAWTAEEHRRVRRRARDLALAEVRVDLIAATTGAEE